MKVKEKVDTIIRIISDPKLSNVRKDVYSFLEEGDYSEILQIRKTESKYRGVKWHRIEIEYVPREEND